MIPYHLTHLALPTPTSSHICKLSCTQASPSPHADTRLRFYRNRTYDIRHPLMPRCWPNHDVRGAYTRMLLSTTSSTPTTTAPSLAPRIHSTVAISKSNTPKRASGRFSKFPSFQGLKRASISSKTSQTLFKVYRVLKGFKVLRVSRAKGSHLRVSTLVHTPMYCLLLVAM